MSDHLTVSPSLYNPISENLQKLAALFPAVVKDGELDLEALREELGEFREIQPGDEKYELNWVGKQAAKKKAFEPLLGKTLKFLDDSKHPETTQNLFIEGDNLEALKLLRQNYFGEVKMIYIDPPYNTGKDFVYKDDFKISRSESAKEEGTVSKTGEDLMRNEKTSNRFHARWLDMMHPRLRIAKDLLREDGAIFISIDDAEVANLRRVCDEIFGEDNFVACIVWKRKRGRDNSARWFSKSHEYVLLYAKSIQLFETNFLELDDETKDAYKNPDNDARGVWRMLACWARGTQSGVSYEFTTKSGQHFSRRLWLFSKESLTKLDDEEKLVIRGDNIYRKLFLTENKGKIPETLWGNVSNAANAADEIKRLFDEKIVFDTPKPVPYVREMLRIATNSDSIVLDFFSGSATTANAVMELNAEDNGKRRFIMVQLPEPTPVDSEARKAGLRTIAEIGKERIRRAGEKIITDKPLMTQNLDIGFKSFRIEETKINWLKKDLQGEELDFAGMSDKDALDFVPGFTDIDIVYELMLRQANIPLTDRIMKLTDAGKRTYLYGESHVICLEEQINKELVEALAALEPTPLKFFFRDSAFGKDIALKDETFRRLSTEIAKCSDIEAAYTVEFI